MNRIMKVMLCQYLLTGVCLIILTVLLSKCQLTEDQVNGGILCSYVVANLAGGYFLGKLSNNQRYLRGLLLGGLYYFFLFLVSFGIYHTMKNGMLMTGMLFGVCSGSGMFGGMLSNL